MTRSISSGDEWRAQLLFGRVALVQDAMDPASPCLLAAGITDYRLRIGLTGSELSAPRQLVGFPAACES